MAAFDKVKRFLEGLKEEDVIFKKHFYEKVMDRPISEVVVREYLKKTDRLLKVEEQPARAEGEEKYKLWIRLSNRYSLVVIATVSKKCLYIIIAWNTDRKWQKSIQR